MQQTWEVSNVVCKSRELLKQGKLILNAKIM